MMDKQDTIFGNSTDNAEMRDAMIACSDTTTKPHRNLQDGKGAKGSKRTPLLTFAAGFALVMSVMLLVSNMAMADTVTLRPDGVTATGTWTGVTAANLNDDIDGSYANVSALDTFTVSIGNNALYSGATINSVTIRVRAQAPAGGGQTERIDAGPTGALSGTPLDVNRPAYTNLSFAAAGPFTDVDVDNLEVDVAVNRTAGEEVRVAEIFVDVDYSPAASANELASCGDCHTYGPTDGTRGTSTGAVVGSHTAHNAYVCSTCHVVPAGGEVQTEYKHRNGDIQFAANIQGGFYDKNGDILDNDAPFAQTNAPALASCENVACHNGTTTPTWGGTAACDSCHGLPPATNAHLTHYTAKGWATGVTTNCTQCHPDNEAVSHSSVTDSTVEVTLAPSGSSPAITCGSAPALGCHNGSTTPTTPAWNTSGITCLQCHTVGDVTNTNPTSGLHDETPVVSGVQHDDSINAAGCQTCHREAGGKPSATHVDGTADTPSDFASAVVTVGYAAGAPATCTASCHNENGNSGPWARKWHENSDLTTGAECAGCHGVWGSWNGGVTHRTDADPEGTHGTGTYKCKDCHAIEGAGYTFTSTTADWDLDAGETSNHGNNQITMNADPSHTFGRDGGVLSGCAPCHGQYDGTDGASNQHSFTTTGWTLETVDGDVINAGCDSCHGGSGQYWPNGASYPDRAGRHQKHMEQLAARLNITLASATDAEQKQMCDYCHNDAAGAGGGGHNDGGTPVEPADIGGFNHIGDAAADGGGTWTDASETCAVACHNTKTTQAGTYGWNDAGTSTCTMCHTIGGAGTADPNSGLHDIAPTVSGQQHDTGLTACTTCHDSMPAMTTTSTHINNTFTADGPANTDRGLFAAYTDAGPGSCSGGLVGDAAGCHGTTNTGGPTPNGDDGTWARKWSDAISNPTFADGNNECAGCHGDFTNGWNYSGAVAGNVDHDRDWDTNNGAEVEANHDGTDKCTVCHVTPAAPYSSTWSSGDHGNGTIDMNSTFGYTQGSWDCASACHTGSPDNDNHNLEDSGWNVTTLAGPAPSCTGCHGGGAPSAGVSADSPHSTNTIFASKGVTYTCEDCHTAHGAGPELIPENPAVGIDYPTVGHGDAISLGGAGAPGASEAEICWSCHDLHGVSEWGVNTDTNGAGTNYDFGQIYTSNSYATPTSDWTSGWWKSAVAGFDYKKQAIQTTHAANATNGVSGVDAVGDIRCSYCHDVHDTADRTGVIATADDPDGKPFLRGNWKGNPYLEDGAPQSGTNYTAQTNYGPIPRGGTAYRQTGGYYIDQNTPNTPTSMGWTADNSSGLCELCHGNGDGWTAAEINNLNEFGTASNDWVGNNGHSNAVLGGDGSLRVNIYNETDRKPTDGFLGTTGTDRDSNGEGDDGFGAGMPDMGYMQTPGRGFGLRGNTTEGEGFAVEPQMPVNRPYGWNAFNWGVNVDDASNELQYHQFSCSKCHNPHASRLPRLMITNCLDTKQNSWDDAYTVSVKGTTNQAGSEQIWDDNSGVQLSNATSAQNCHRVKYSGSPAGGSGWNNVTPW